MDAKDVTGALRAIGCMAKAWEAGDSDSLEAARRDDLAALFDVLASALDHKLSTVQRHVHAVATGERDCSHSVK